MPKLTDTQLIILNTAIGRKTHTVLNFLIRSQGAKEGGATDHHAKAT